MKTKFLFIALLFTIQLNAQKSSNVLVKWAPGALAAGKISIIGEYNFKPRKSVTLQVGIPNSRTYTVDYDGKESDIKIEGTSVLAGFRYYLSKRQVSGFYIEPYGKYVSQEGSGILNGDLVNEPADFDSRFTYKAFGVGAQLGVQFLIAKRVALDFYILGPEANISEVGFKARDISSTLPWTQQAADEARADIEETIRDIPIIGKKTEITVDRATKTVSVDYDGFLPSLRAGVSIGIRF
ncbi:MAG: DUF3575 domain-containing protein [Flavitalea sp.]